MSVPAALITGGTSGFGEATAELLQSRGYRVMVTGDDSVANAGLAEDVVIVRADALLAAKLLAPGLTRTRFPRLGRTQTTARRVVS